MKTWAWAIAPLILIAIVLAIAAHYGTVYRGWAFLGVLALLAGELAIIGWLVNDRPIGAFVDNRNKLSLSKLQAGAWTVVVLASLATAAIFNILTQGGDSSSVTGFDVKIPGELLLAMGMSATSLVAAPALLSVKADQEPHPDAVDKTADKMRISPEALAGNSVGKVVNKPDVADASWGDLVTGDEVGNAASPDLGKIQQLLITVLLLGGYVIYVFNAMSTSAAPLHELPAVDQSFVWLLGISHASYLAYKAAPHTQTA